MGGRGASSSGGGGSVKTVPYDSWGKMKEEWLRDKDGNLIGTIKDDTRYIYEPDIRPITKKEILSDIDGWRNDDGTYGDQDTAIYLAYKDGSFVNVNDLDGKAYKKSGIVGASISTADYESAWGGEVNKKTGNIDPWTVHNFDDDGNEVEGKANSYSGHKATGKYIVRTKTTYNNPNPRRDGTYITKYETLRKSTVKPMD